MDKKKEFIMRYRYLVLNSDLLFSGMYQRINNENILIYEDVRYEDMIIDYLFNDETYTNSYLYQEIEYLKKDINFLKKVKLNIINNNGIGSNYWNILNIIRNFIINNYDMNNERYEMLKTLDIYYLVNRVNKNNRFPVSGYHLELEDINCNKLKYINANSNNRYEYQIKENTNRRSNFCNYFSNYNNIFTETDLEKIYLSLYNELSYLEMITCDYNDIDNINIGNKPCNSVFYLNEEDIVFHDGDFYQVCPRCGYLVKLDELLIKDSIQERIINKTRKKQRNIK